MRASVLSDLGQSEAALADLDHALALDPFESSGWQNRGAILNRLDRPDEALASFVRALALDPFNLAAWFNRGCSERRLGQNDAAQRSLTRFLELAAHADSKRMPEQVEEAQRLLAGLAQGGEPPVSRPVVRLAERPQQVLGGRFELYQELGRGAFGAVHLAWCREPEGVVALKTMLPAGADAAARLADFRREAELWLRLDSHPNLVSVQQVDQLDGRLCIAMDLVVAEEDGFPTLDGWLRHRPPGLVQALRWAIQFCHGMEHAYAKGLSCHRDIKPANILIDHRRQVRISDFGLAGTHGERMDGVAGTPTHMPPEQWRAAALCDQRSDIYAFGVTLFQMAAGGRVPFAAAPPRDDSPDEQRRCFAELARLHATAPVPTLESPLAAIIERCLRKDPTLRYPGFAALRAELEALLFGQAGERLPPPQVETFGRELLMNKALSLEALGRNDEALRCHDQAIAADPGWAPSWTAKGVCLAGLRRHGDAALCLAKAIELDPGHAPAWAAKGSLERTLGRCDDALRCYDQAIAIRPDYGLALRNRGNVLVALGRTEEALASYARGLELDPGSALGWAGQAWAQNIAGRHADALASAERALALHPTLGDAWKGKADALRRTGRNAEALAAYEHACAGLPDDADCWANRGGALSALGRNDEALASVERALQLAPGQAMLWNNKGSMLIELKRYPEALAALEHALKLEPDHQLALCNRGVCLRDMGRPAQALAVLEQARERHPGDTRIVYTTADLLLRLGRHADALPLFVAVGRGERGNRRAAAMAWHHAGECLLVLGDPAQAGAAWQNAVQADPAYAPPRAALERLGRPIAPPAAPAPAASAPTPFAAQDTKSLLHLANKSAEAGMHAEALQLIDMILASNPRDLQALDSKGMLLGVMGRHAEAIDSFAAYLALEPGDISVLLKKALTEDDAGRAAAAAASYRRFLALLPPEARAQLAAPIAHAQARIATLEAAR
jgi:tetratricopeptide (TPR) repeat protein